MKKNTLLSFTLILIGCGGSWWRAVPIVGPDGSDNWVAISCNHRMDCIVLAGRECPYGWNIVEDNTSVGQETRAYSSQYAGAVSSKSVKEIDLLVRCKNRPNLIDQK